MNIWDHQPDIPKCPHCGHDGEGLQWAFPDNAYDGKSWAMVKASCLHCGAHSPAKPSYEEAIKAFAAGETEPNDGMDEIRTRSA